MSVASPIGEVFIAQMGQFNNLECLREFNNCFLLDGLRDLNGELCQAEE